MIEPPPDTITPPTPPEPTELARPLRLSQEIEGLLEMVREEPLHVAEVIEVLQGRAYNLLLILLALPFCTPILIPGLSTPFGWVISIIGLRLALGQRPWLPGKVLGARLQPRIVRPLLLAARRVARMMEWLLRPRLPWLVEFSPLHRAYGVMIAFCGFLLLLPLPVPFSNLLPAVTVALLAAGLMEKDGASIIAGTVTFAATVVFFAMIFLGGKAVMVWLRALFGGHFEPVD